jgi:GT2 family glycosyltransferase
MDKVAIIILNWNGIEDTLKCLQSLRGQTHQNYKVIVIDNGSRDNSKDKLGKYKKTHKGEIDIVYNPKNFGFAGGVNTGIEYALNEDYDYVALFNNDAVADKNWLKNLIMAAEDKQVGIVTGLLLDQSGETIDSTSEQYSIWGLPFPRNRGDKAEKAPKGELVFGATGGASIYKVEMLKDIGFFDENFFAYYEDVDISFRAQLAGWKVCYEPKAIAYHKKGESSKKIPGFTVYQTFKNLPLLFIKNIPRKLLLKTGARFYLAYTLMFLKAIKKGSGWHALRGLARSLFYLPSSLSLRRDIQHNKRVDSDYIRSILWPNLPPDQTGMRKLRKFFTGK